jgi:pectin methylesterase-like acyl-CoA thioesterase
MNCSFRCFLVPMLLPTAWIVGGVGCSSDGSNRAAAPAAPDTSSRGGAGNAVAAGAGQAGAAGGPAGGGRTATGGTAAVGGSGTAAVGGSGTAAVGGSGTAAVGGSGGSAQGGANGGHAGAAAGRSSGGASTNGGASVAQSGGGSGGGGGVAAGGAADASLCPPGITRTVRVAKDGSGQFSTVQAAIDSIPDGSSEHVRMDLAAGTYTEKLTIASRSNLCLVGDGATRTILSYDDSNGKVGSTSGSASVMVSADDFSAANLTIQNTFGPGSQAVALRVTGQRQQFLDCRFVGYQDTLYLHQGTQYFRNCYVQGNTDYVFGGATSVLENCELRNVEGGSAVAAPNTDIGTAHGIVFLGGSFTAAASVRANSVGLGRPWGADGAAAYLRVTLGAHVIAEGFVPMSDNQPENARFHEYGSEGIGANAARRQGYQLTDSEASGYTVSNVLGAWRPSYSE